MDNAIFNIPIKDFDYDLPEEKIAKYPLSNRSSSKLLIYKSGNIEEDNFINIHHYLPENSLLFYNNSKVIKARLIFANPHNQQKIELFCLEPTTVDNLPAGQIHYKCFVGNNKKWDIAQKLSFEFAYQDKQCTLFAKKIKSIDNAFEIAFEWQPTQLSFFEIIEQIGHLPIPPYLKRDAENIDNERYQTFFAKELGSVAAPTAGLHFTDEIFKNCEQKNIKTYPITLHVGAGTFLPIKTANAAQHNMHTEHFAVSKLAIEQLHAAANNKNIIAVGTTTARTLESLYWLGQKINQKTPTSVSHLTQWEAYQLTPNLTLKESLELVLNYLEKNNIDTLAASTQLMITPQYTFKVINGLITNFHQPQSTLLLLVSALIGKDWKKVYDYALQHNFRFLSYGDSSLLLK